MNSPTTSATPQIEVTDAMIEAACQARCKIGGVHWADGLTEGAARIERMLTEDALRAGLAHSQPLPVEPDARAREFLAQELRARDLDAEADDVLAGDDHLSLSVSTTLGALARAIAVPEPTHQQALDDALLALHAAKEWIPSTPGTAGGNWHVAVEQLGLVGLRALTPTAAGPFKLLPRTLTPEMKAAGEEAYRTAPGAVYGIALDIVFPAIWDAAP